MLSEFLNIKNQLHHKNFWTTYSNYVSVMIFINHKFGQLTFSVAAGGILKLV